jgi:NADPH:quinone reductase
MRALQLVGYDGPPALNATEVPAPESADDAGIVDVEAVGINFPDLLITQGRYQLKPELPFVSGCEIAGRIRSAPAGRDRAPGEPVAAFVWSGGYPEHVSVPLTHLIRVDAGTAATQAAALVVNYHTVYYALRRRGRLQAGETMLVLGAGGGIGTAAVQVALGLGAQVIGRVADAEQEATALRAGAPVVVRLDEGFAGGVRRLTGGRGVDVVLDPLGDWIFTEACTAWPAMAATSWWGSPPTRSRRCG